MSSLLNRPVSTASRLPLKTDCERGDIEKVRLALADPNLNLRVGVCTVIKTGKIYEK